MTCGVRDPLLYACRLGIGELTAWHRRTNSYECLPVFIWWHTWLMRNRLVFNDKTPDIHLCAILAIGNDKEYQLDQYTKTTRLLSRPQLLTGMAIGFFDGAAQRGAGGCGTLFQINCNRCFHPVVILRYIHKHEIRATGLSVTIKICGDHWHSTSSGFRRP